MTHNARPAAPAPVVTHRAILSLSAFYGGALREYVTADRVTDAIARFGHALAVDWQTDADGARRAVVTCATQRGDTGSMRLHSIACAYGIPVHTDTVTPAPAPAPVPTFGTWGAAAEYA